MAIAPLSEGSERDAQPRRGLRLVQGGRPTGAAPRGTAKHARRDSNRAAEDLDALRRSRAAHPSAGVPMPASERALHPGSARQRAVRPSSVSLRRRRVGLAVVLLSVVLLALPLRALGAVTVDGRPTPGAVPAGLAPGSVYVVQPGDTLRSIAQQVDPGAVAATVRALAASTGASTVVPGEHVRIP
jgi:hypothetical protein